MKRNHAYKTELQLNDRQKMMVENFIGGARFAYNWGLAERIKLFQTQGKSTSAIDQHKELNKLKKTLFPWMYECSKCVFQEALRDLHVAYGRFFKGLKPGQKKVGFPKFKSKHGSKQSFRLTGIIHVFDGYIQLPKLGRLKLKEIGYLPKDKKILSATVSKKAGRYFVSLSAVEDCDIPQNYSQDIIGIDFGISNLATASNGEYFENPRAYKKLLKKLSKAQRELSRKKKGGKNREKQRQKLATIHFKIASIRKDNIHKMTTKVVKVKPQRIVIENLSVKNMLKNRKLSQSISDASFFEIRRQFEYKCRWGGVELVIADRYFPSSKLCSCCGNKKEELALSERVYDCEICGIKIDRDLNAAINLKKHTGSSSGIHASGEDVNQERNLLLSSLKEEYNKNSDLNQNFVSL